VACQSQEADDQVARAWGAGSVSGLVEVFAEGDVVNPVERVLDSRSPDMVS
jgi:hypothetical protein